MRIGVFIDMNFKLIVIMIFCIVTLYNILIALLQLRSSKNAIPANVADVYDAATYEKWCAYRKEKCHVSIIHHIIGLIVDIILITFDIYAAFADLFSDNVVTQIFAVILLSTLTDIFTMPIDYYDTMKIEGKYGFNRTTAGTFFADKIKEYVISIGILTMITWILALLHQALGDYMIIAFAGALIVLIIVFSFLFPLFTRIFNKFQPLEEGELRSKLTQLLEKHGYHVRAIEVMDASRRSTKANAYFAGLGKTKSIVLYDTLLEKMTPDEICGIFAHELGHGLHHDTLRGQIVTFVQMLLIAVMAWLTLRYPELFAQFGFDGINYGFAVIMIMTVEFALFAPVYEIAANALSRSYEYGADRCAAEEGYGQTLITALKKLTKTDFGDVAPSPALILLKFSHPSLSQRIDALEAFEKQKSETK